MDEAAALTGCDHLRRKGLRTDQRTGEIYREDPIPGLEVDISGQYIQLGLRAVNVIREAAA